MTTYQLNAPTATGGHVLYNAQPSWECPGSTGAPILEALEAGGFAGDAELVAGLIARRGHYRARRPGLERPGSRPPLTDRCATCGCKMRNRGYRVWVEEPVDETTLPPGASWFRRSLGDPQALTVTAERWASSRANARKIASELLAERQGRKAAA